MSISMERIESIYKEHSQGLYGYAVCLLRDTEKAKDCLQSVFLDVAGLENESKIENVKAYMMVMVRHEAYKMMKKRKEESLDGMVLLETADESKVSVEEAMMLEKALLALPEDQREAVMLKEYSGFTFDEIAKMLKVSINTVSGRYRYALAKLKKALEE